MTAVTANDVDTNPALTYSFTEDNEDASAFSIDRFSGKITLGKKLDYESKKEYKLTIMASDTAHVAQTSLTIQVTDVNDNAPVFWQPSYQASLPGKLLAVALDVKDQASEVFHLECKCELGMDIII